MLFSGIRLTEGAELSNVVAPSGTTFPPSPGVGELFFRTDEMALYVWDGNATWIRLDNVLSVGDIVAALGYTPVNKAGDTMSGALVLNADPVNLLGAATKQYVDNIATGLSFKQSVTVATTGNITLNGLQTVDGVVLTVSDRVLVKDQAIASQNGIYDAKAGTWTRSTDFDNSIEVEAGAYMFVREGNTYANSGWVLNTTGVITIGVTALAFTQFTGLAQVEAGAGLTKSGSTINIETGSSSRIVVNADSIDLALTGVASGTYKSVSVDLYGRVVAGSNPTTIAGYGITDAQPLDSNLTAIASLAGSGIIIKTAEGAATTRSIAVSGTGLSVTFADGVSGNPTITSNATNANTASAIVSRDASGNFSAGSITAALVGNASTASVWLTPRTMSLTGDATGTSLAFDGSANASIGVTLANTSVTNGAYGSASQVAAFTVDSKGRLTAAGNTNITIISSAITDFAEAVQDAIGSGFVISGGGITATYNDAANTITLGSTATNLNAASAIVARDGSGNFSASTITAALSGNALTATALQTGRTFSVTGDATGTSLAFDGSANASIGVTLANTAVSASSYGSASQVASFTVDSKGRLTAAGNTPIAVVSTAITDFTEAVQDVVGGGFVVDGGGITATYSDAANTLTLGSTATSTNTVSAIVTRDGSGNFSAGTITAALTGNASTATTWQTARSMSLTGDATGTSGAFNGSADASISVTLANTTVISGSYGTAAQVAAFTVDSKGRLTTAANTNIAIPTSAVTSGTFADARIAQSNVTQHEAALTILESQITDNSILSRNASNETITGSWTFNDVVVGQDPTLAAHLATKNYVDTITTGLSFKQSVRVATTGNITLSAPQTIDGVLVIAGERVLVKDQSTASQNGIYDVAAGAWVRSTDFDGSPASEVDGGAYMFVREGTTYANSGWVLSTAGPITLDTTPLSFTQFTGLAQIEAGTGMTKTGTTLNVIGTAGRIVANANSIDLASGVVTVDTYRSVTVDTYGRVTAGTNPTTIAGYGIVDAQPLDSDLTAIAALSSTGIIVRTGTGSAATRSIDVSGTGLSVTNGDGVLGNPTITSDATSLNTASAIVARDGSGNFSANTITAALTGNASTATALQTGRTFSLTGDATGTSLAFDGSANASISMTLANTAVAAGSYGAATQVATFTVDAKGRLTTAGNTTIAVTSSAITDFTEAVQDAVGTSFIVNGGGITATYSDVVNTLTLGSTATSDNTASAIVARDASGNFSAGTITATLSGNASTATLADNVTGIVAIANGGTGATTAAATRTNLGLGSIATQNSNSISITGGAITGITDLAIADGGTGASTAEAAANNLGVPKIAPATPKDGDIRVTGAVIDIYASGAWRQIFPAVYS